MSTTPETPALPGDLTDETIERGAKALAAWEGVYWEGDWEGVISRDAYRNGASIVLAAARVAPVTPRETGDPFTCTDLGHEDCDGGHPDHRPAPSPDREKLAEELSNWAGLAGYGPGHVTARAAAALAVPPVVNKAKLEQALIGSLRDNAMMFENGAEEWIAESDPAECLPGLIESLVERQREWLA